MKTMIAGVVIFLIICSLEALAYRAVVIMQDHDAKVAKQMQNHYQQAALEAGR